MIDRTEKEFSARVTNSNKINQNLIFITTRYKEGKSIKKVFWELYKAVFQEHVSDWLPEDLLQYSINVVFNEIYVFTNTRIYISIWPKHSENQLLIQVLDLKNKQ